MVYIIHFQDLHYLKDYFNLIYGIMIKKNIFKLSDRWNWEALRGQIKTHGVANSLLLAPMPTASTSHRLWVIQSRLNHIHPICSFAELLRGNL